MRNFILFTVLLFSGFVSAQSFDFSCNTAPYFLNVSGGGTYEYGSKVSLTIHIDDNEKDDLHAHYSTPGVYEAMSHDGLYGDYYLVLYPDPGTYTYVFEIGDGNLTATSSVTFTVKPEPGFLEKAAGQYVRRPVTDTANPPYGHFYAGRISISPTKFSWSYGAIKDQVYIDTVEGIYMNNFTYDSTRIYNETHGEPGFDQYEFTINDNSDIDLHVNGVLVAVFNRN